MKATASLKVNTSIDEAWEAISNIESAKDRISAIDEIEILEKPESGLVGLKWKETRTMFGKSAVETMWIIEAKEKEYYIAEAYNCGSLYHSKVVLTPHSDGVEKSMSFEAEAKTFVAKLFTPLMAFMKGTIVKAFEKDLEDLNEYLTNSDK
jgi:hypothetical protein